MSEMLPVFKSAFSSWTDEYSGQGIRPVVFDVCAAADWTTSLLPDELKMVLHVNPSSLKFTNKKQIERIQTKGGWVEQHWGDAASEMSMEMATGGFMRLASGLSNITRPGPGTGGQDLGGGRRDTIAYDKFLDMLALFHSNGSVYDQKGAIAFQGIIKMTFDGGTWYGWFTTFSVTEMAEKPFQFNLSCSFQVQREVHTLRTLQIKQTDTSTRFDAAGAYSGDWAPPTVAAPAPGGGFAAKTAKLKAAHKKEGDVLQKEEDLVKANEKRVKPAVPPKPKGKRRKKKKKKVAAVYAPTPQDDPSLAVQTGTDGKSRNIYGEVVPQYGQSYYPSEACFTGDTLVHLHDGSVISLEQLPPGRKIMTLNPKTLQESFATVLKVSIVERSEIVRLRFQHSSTRCTFEHPIWVKGKGWSSYSPEMSQRLYKMKVFKLEVGDAVIYRSPEGKFVESRLMQITQSLGSQTVYMPVLEGYQSFFADGVLVHIPGGA